MVTKEEMVEAVKAHARKHYEEGGWDYVIECYGDEDIVEAAGGVVSVEEAIEVIGRIVGIADDQRKDVMAEIF